MDTFVFFEKSWREGNFLVPEDVKIRAELLTYMKKASHIGKIWMPEYEDARRVLSARIKMLEAYDIALKG